MTDSQQTRAIYTQAHAIHVPLIKFMTSLAIFNTGEYTPEAIQHELNHVYGSVIDQSVADGLALMSLDPQNKSILGACYAEHDRGIVWLSWLVVADRVQNNGVGTNLLYALCDKITAEETAHKICCFSMVSNVASAKVLEKCGFTKVVELKNHWYGLDYFLWEKFL